jgi:hypothetical protein
LEHVGEYFQATYILARFSHAPTSFNIASTLPTVYLKLDDCFFDFL